MTMMTDPSKATDEPRYTQGIMADGAAILDDGVLITVEQILDRLNAAAMEDVSLLFRGVELGGEAGEALNVIKKLERERLGWRGSRATPEQLAEELADVVICADLIAMQPDLGIDLGAAVVAKFNATSEARGLKTRIAAPPPPPAGEPVAEPLTHGLWCVHIIGPDDIYAAPDIVTAARWAHAANRVGERANKGVSDDDYVLFHANVEPFSYSAERHAEWLPKAIAEMMPRAVRAEPHPDLRPGLERALEVIEAGEEEFSPDGRYLRPRSEGNLAGTGYMDAIRAELDRLGGAS